MSSAVAAREAHARCCAAQERNDVHAELGALADLIRLLTGHALQSRLVNRQMLLRQQIDASPGASTTARISSAISGLEGETDGAADAQVHNFVAGHNRGVVRRGPDETREDMPSQRQRTGEGAASETNQVGIDATSPATTTTLESNLVQWARPAPVLAVHTSNVDTSVDDAPGAGGAINEALASQCSQASEMPATSQADSLDEYKCPICLNTLFEPITHSCGNSFCRHCYFPAIASAAGAHGRTSGGPGHKACPMCRKQIPLEEARDAAINEPLWSKIQLAHPVVVARRRKQLERDGYAAVTGIEFLGRQAGDYALPAESIVNAVDAQSVPLSLRRDLARQEMQDHRSVLQAANRDYFRLLEVELARPLGELVRCNCPARFVAIRRIGGAHSANPGRQFYGCPLWRPGGSREARNANGCGFYQWVV